MPSTHQSHYSEIIFALTYDTDHTTKTFQLTAHIATPILPTHADTKHITTLADSLAEILSRYLHPPAPNPLLVKHSTNPDFN